MKKNGVMRRFARELAHPANITLLCFWLAFVAYSVVIWGESALFGARWWLDTAAHATYGSAGALTLFYLFVRYAARGAFNFAGRFFLSTFIVCLIMFIGFLWEIVELFWDVTLQPSYLDWVAKAQQGSVDTMSDLFVNTISAVLAVFARKIFDDLYDRRYPDEAMRVNVEEMRARLEHVSRDLREQRLRHGPRFRRLLKSFRRPPRAKAEAPS